MLAPLEGGTVLDRTPREGFGWFWLEPLHHGGVLRGTSHRGFQVKPITYGSRHNPLCSVLGNDLTVLQVEPLKKVLPGIKSSSPMGTNQRTPYGSS